MRPGSSAFRIFPLHRLQPAHFMRWIERTQFWGITAPPPHRCKWYWQLHRLQQKDCGPLHELPWLWIHPLRVGSFCLPDKKLNLLHRMESRWLYRNMLMTIPRCGIPPPVFPPVKDRSTGLLPEQPSNGRVLPWR